MSTTVNTVTLASLLLLPVGLANAANGNSSFKVLFGAKSLDSDWGDDDSMDTIGFQFTYLPTSSPVGIALDFYGSGNENQTNGVTTETGVAEINFGLRWQAPVLADSFIPYLGGGVSILGAELQSEQSGSKKTYEDESTGYWIGGGVDYLIADQWSVGLDAHYSSSDMTLNGEERDAGGFTWGLTAGYHF
ncbi:outer membrane beta-barrel protein [Vibrio sp. WJH972]